MIASNIDGSGNIDKRKKVMSGPCVIPFKYKRIEHTGCIQGDRGMICATEVNPKTGTMTKFGYCSDDGDAVTASEHGALPPVASVATSGVSKWKDMGQSGETGKEGEVRIMETPEGLVAVKFFKLKKSVAKVRAEAEMQKRAAESGAAPAVLDVLVERGKRPAIVMEKMGKTVVEVCKEQGGITRDQAKAIWEAYQRLTDSGVLHNDSNPLNLMLGEDGTTWKFVDFGFAKSLPKGKENDNFKVHLKFLMDKLARDRGCKVHPALREAQETGVFPDRDAAPMETKYFHGKSRHAADLKTELGALNWRRVLSMEHQHPLVLDGVQYDSAASAFLAKTDESAPDEEALPVMAGILSERYRQDPDGFGKVIDVLNSKNWRLVHQDQRRGVPFWGAHVDPKTKRERGGNVLGRMMTGLVEAKASE